jgi:Zn-dependent M28 family amino/carboxypeptidase
MTIDRVARLLVPSLLLGCAGAPPAGTGEGSISASEFRAHVATLASDEFEGRKPGTRGETRTVEYLEDAFRSLGLAPGHGDSYRQAVPLVEITAAADARLSFATPAGEQALAMGTDAVIWTKRVVPEVEVSAIPVVFVGYGVVAPEYAWDDYAGVDVRGKAVVILINDPGFSTGDETLFRGRALTYYGRWTYKLEEAARQGAAAAFIVHETEPAAYGWATVVNSWSGPQLDAASADGNAGRVAIEGWLSLPAAQRLLEASGLDFAELKTRANTRGFRAVPLDARASGALRNGIRRSTSDNVIAQIPGSKRPGEVVLYLAHWDHLGRSLASSGDTVFNGAVDNATGTAALLAIASAMRRDRRPPERTVVFLAVTAEEAGLIGSAYYARNPLFPLAQTVAALNMDAIYFGGPTRDVSVVGFGASELEDDLARAAAAQGRVLTPEPTPEKGFFYRSDHFNFAKEGVPSLYFKLGIDDRERGIEHGRREAEAYNAQRYHTVADEYFEGADLRGAIEDVGLMLEVGRGLANSTRFPNWREGNEFRAARDRSRAIAEREP